MFTECSHEHTLSVVRTFAKHFKKKHLLDVPQMLDFLVGTYPPNILGTFIEHSRKYLLGVH